MTKNLLYLSAMVLLTYSCHKEILDSSEPIDLSSISYQSIDDHIRSYTDRGEIYHWRYASPEQRFMAGMLSDSIFTMGYTLTGQKNLEDFIGTEQILNDTWLKLRTDLVNQVLEIERRHRPAPNLQLKDILPFPEDNYIPTVGLVLGTIESVKFLDKHDKVRYIEPSGYDLLRKELKSSSGCDGSPDYNINTADYSTTTSFNAKIPWNFSNHNIQQAWSVSSGNGIGVCIIDTGVSDNQPNLGSSFSSGNSTGRSITKLSTHYSGMWWWRKLDTPNDPCGHGTSMSGLAAAPWSTNGNALGAAYRSNLISIRAVEDVIISTSDEREGVKNALIIAGNRNDVKIISMSIGNIISSSSVSDGVVYAFNKGKLIFAAAGTSTSFTNWTGVIFPANMSQAVAVTGVKAQSSYDRCNTCHSGSQVDFTLQMQRSFDSNRNSVALATSSSQPKYISGSSCATATTAGIAALVWATNPNMSRNDVVTRLRNASHLRNNRSSQYGWGNINAQAAVQGVPY